MSINDDGTMPPHEKHTILSHIRALYDHVYKLPDSKACSTCKHWNFNAQHGCDKFMQLPPPDVQEVGCAEWVFDAESPPF